MNVCRVLLYKCENILSADTDIMNIADCEIGDFVVYYIYW